MSREYRSLVKSVDNALKKRLANRNIRICILLLGPGDSDGSDGRSLRTYLEKKCKGFGVVVKGEHKELLRMFNHRTDGLMNLCQFETWFAIEHAQAVIIIPYSAGSLAEMGMFTWQPKVCSKTMLIFSDEFPESKRSFISMGTTAHYRSKGATVACVKYSDRRRVWKEVKDFLWKYKAEKLEEVLLEDA